MMDSSTIAFWVNELNTEARKHFPEKWSNTTVHYINDAWVVRMVSPEVVATCKSADDAISRAMSELKREISKKTNLARTLGLEAAE